MEFLVSTYGVILSILASNKNVNSQNVTVTLFKGGVGGTAARLITSGEVPAKSSLEFMTRNKLIVEPSDVIKAYASAASSIDITVSYMLNPQDTSILTMPYIGNIVQDFSVNTAMLNTDSVTSIKIDDGTIVNADINDSAAIAMSKLALSITNSDVNASAGYRYKNFS